MEKSRHKDSVAEKEEKEKESVQVLMINDEGFETKSLGVWTT